MKTKAELLLSTSQTVFTVDDLAILWQISDRSRLWELIKYYTRTNRLHSIQRGVYALSEDYSPFETAVKLFPPAYISFTTALAHHGAFFQYSSEVHAMAQASKRLEIASGQVFVYHQLKNDILLNQQGIEKADGYWIASLERAICDTSYLVPSFAFEYLNNVNPQKLEQLSKLYGNKALQNRIKKIISIIREERYA
jgi:predicted transcriptional regulator of viral defense system